MKEISKIFSCRRNFLFSHYVCAHLCTYRGGWKVPSLCVYVCCMVVYEMWRSMHSYVQGSDRRGREREEERGGRKRGRERELAEVDIQCFLSLSTLYLEIRSLTEPEFTVWSRLTSCWAPRIHPGARITDAHHCTFLLSVLGIWTLSGPSCLCSNHFTH